MTPCAAIRRALVLGALLLIARPADAGAWEIRRFNSALEVGADAVVDVTETLEVDFQNEPRHGIYRDLPVDYLDRFSHRLRLRWELVTVTDDTRGSPPYTVSRRGRYRRIRIGDPDRTVTGVHTYILRYRVGRALLHFPDHDELFWNVTGNEWGVPIALADAAVRLPAGASAESAQAAAFTGAFGSLASRASITRASGEVRCATTDPLGPYEGLTIVVGWPTGLVRFPSWWQQLAWWLLDNWGYGLPVLTLLGMWAAWRRWGREYPGRGSIAVEYEPPDGLTPAETGTLIDDRVNLRDLTATVIDLARRGYLTIEPDVSAWLHRITDYRFLKRRAFDTDTSLAPHDRLMLTALFGSLADERALSDLENQFYDDIPAMREAIYDRLIAQGYLSGRPDELSSRYRVAALVIAGIGVWLFSSGVTLSVPIGLLLSAAIVAAFSRWMPRKTRRGRDLVDRIRGFEEFLTRTDRDRLARLDNPQAVFERMLPYALALGVATQWGKLFDGVALTAPAWYHGDPSTFSPRHFAGRMDQATRSMASTFTSSPRTAASSGLSGFGGGGSSGGGFGGGGGGSW